MFEKIEIFDKRYSELSERLYQPSVAGNPEAVSYTHLTLPTTPYV